MDNSPDPISSFGDVYQDDVLAQIEAANSADLQAQAEEAPFDEAERARCQQVLDDLEVGEDDLQVMRDAGLRTPEMMVGFMEAVESLSGQEKAELFDTARSATRKQLTTEQRTARRKQANKSRKRNR